VKCGLADLSQMQSAGCSTHVSVDILMREQSRRDSKKACSPLFSRKFYGLVSYLWGLVD
jgi:hypothetical protein